MIFKALKIVGEISIETLDYGTVSLGIVPMDDSKLQKVSEIEKTISSKNAKNEDKIFGYLKFFELLCIDFKREYLKGIPIETIPEMIMYINDVAMGKKQTKEEKKNQDLTPIIS